MGSAGSTGPALVWIASLVLLNRPQFGHTPILRTSANAGFAALCPFASFCANKSTHQLLDASTHLAHLVQARMVQARIIKFYTLIEASGPRKTSATVSPACCSRPVGAGDAVSDRFLGPPILELFSRNSTRSRRRRHFQLFSPLTCDRK